ncbi:MAG: phosphopentomutase [Bacillota bacterium]
MDIKRVFIIVLDGAGVGALPDAGIFGDSGSNTLGNIALQRKTWFLPNLISLGLGKIVSLPRQKEVKVFGAFGKMKALSPGKDTTSGHWELAGLVLKKPFPLYPGGFPQELISAFEEKIGRRVLGNKAASGTEIIVQLGEEHMHSGFPIVYTSADSVFQVAAHEDVVEREMLYEWCCIARKEVFIKEHAVGRVIARPFRGEPGSFQRTEGRRDFSLKPPEKTILDLARERDYQVWAAGKVKDIFAGCGITRHLPASGNREIMEVIQYALAAKFHGIFWATLVDFDMLYGHRNDFEGFAKSLEEFDKFLENMITALQEGDLLFITADHGCDPTFPGTDHTREFVPLLVYGPKTEAVDLGTRHTFADVAATVAELLQCTAPHAGKSFATELFERSVVS